MVGLSPGMMKFNHFEHDHVLVNGKTIEQVVRDKEGAKRVAGVSYDEFMVEFRRQVIEAGGQNHFARKHKLSPAYVWGALNGKQKAGAGILNAVGYRQVVTFEKRFERVEKK